MLTVSRTSLEEIVTRALERMTFTVVEPGEAAVADAVARAASHAVIELRGPRSYFVTVSASAGMVREVASGMLGCEPKDVDPKRHGEAVVTELSNVFGGELVIQMSTERDGLRIGLPQSAAPPEAQERCAFAERAGLAAVFVAGVSELVVSVARG